MARKKSRQKFKLKQSKDDKAKKIALSKETETKPKMSFGRRVLKALPLMMLALIFTFVLNRSGVFAEVETTFLDLQMRANAPTEESDVVIVDITQKDFDDKNTFNSQTSPLNVNALQTLIEAIAAGQPCVIGVDVSTYFDQFKDFNTDKLSNSNVVWSRSYQEISEDGKKKIIPRRVLGRQDPALDGKSGLPITKSENGIARYYSRLIETTEGNLPSFAWEIFKAGKERNCEGIKFPDNLEETTDNLIIGYSRGEEGTKGGARWKYDSGEIRKYAENHWQDNNLIKDKIVILSGSYADQDQHQTPLGEKKIQGYEIIANTIETDLRGGGIKQPSFFSKMLLQVFDGFLLISLFQLFSWRKAALMSLPFIIVLSLACSFFTYYSFSYWVFFAPVMIGVVLTELIDKAKDYFKKRYKREITETYREFGGHPDEKQKSVEE